MIFNDTSHSYHFFARRTTILEKQAKKRGNIEHVQYMYVDHDLQRIVFCTYNYVTVSQYLQPEGGLFILLNRLYVYTCTCIYWAVNLVPVIKINETTPIKHFDLTKLFLNTVFLNVHKTLLFQIQPWFISPDKKENLKN